MAASTAAAHQRATWRSKCAWRGGGGVAAAENQAAGSGSIRRNIMASKKCIGEPGYRRKRK